MGQLEEVRLISVALLNINNKEQIAVNNRENLPEPERTKTITSTLGEILKSLDSTSFSTGYQLFRKQYVNLPIRKAFVELVSSTQELEKIRIKLLKARSNGSHQTKIWRDFERQCSIHSDWAKTCHVIINTVLIIIKHVLSGKDIKDITKIEELANYHLVLKSLTKELPSNLVSSLFLFNQYRNALMHMDSARFFDSITPANISEFGTFFKKLGEEINSLNKTYSDTWVDIDRQYLQKSEGDLIGDLMNVSKSV